MQEIAWAIVRKRNRYLLIQRDLDDVSGGLWSFPGGKIKISDHSPMYAAKRELEEETHIMAHDLLELFQTTLDKYKISFFLCDKWEIDPSPGSQTIGVGWFTIPEIYNLDQSLDPFLAKTLPLLAFTVRHDRFGK